MKNQRLLLLTCIFMLTFPIVLQSIPPIMGFLLPAFSITHAQVGALMSLFGLPGILIGIPAGIWVDARGAKRTGMISLLIVLGGSLLVALGSNYYWLMTGRLVSGIGAAVVSIVGPQIVASYFSGPNLGQAIGIFNSTVPLGTICALNLYGRLALFSNWRTPLLLASSLTFAIFFLFKAKFPDERNGSCHNDRIDLRSGITAVRQMTSSVWLIGLIVFLYNSGLTAYLFFAGDYYVSVGYAPNYAEFLSSLLMVGALIFSPVAGYLADRYGRAEYFIAIGGTGFSLLLWLTPKVSINPLFLGVLMGMFAAFIPVPTYSLFAKYLSSTRLGLGYGISGTFVNIGILCGPYLVGYLYDLTNTYVPGFNLMALFMLFIVLTSFLLRSNNKQRQH